MKRSQVWWNRLIGDFTPACTPTVEDGDPETTKIGKPHDYMLSLPTSAAALADSLAFCRSLISTEGAITEDTPSSSGSRECSGYAEAQASLLSMSAGAGVSGRREEVSKCAWFGRKE